MHRDTSHAVWPNLLSGCLLLCSLVLLTCRAQAEPTTFHLAQLQDSLDVIGGTRFWVDAGAGTDKDALPAADDPAWQDNSLNTVNFGQSRSAYWFHLRVDGLQQLDQPTYLRLNYPHLDRIDVYYRSGGEWIAQYHTGDTRVFNSRPVHFRTFLFPLTGLRVDGMDIYLRAASEGPIQVPLDILTRTELDRQDKDMFLWFGAYFGIMIIMLLYNSVIFLFVRHVSYFLYLIYICAIIFLQFTLDGFGFEYLWPGSSHLNNDMILIATGLMPFCAIVFVWNFIGLGKIGNSHERWTAIVLCLGFTVVLTGFKFMHYMTVLKIAHALSFITVIWGFYLGLKYWIKGVKAARIFTIAWFMYLIFIFYYLLEMKSILQPTLVSRHALEIGSVLELVLLSLAFADRLNAEKELRLLTQEKLNQDLDLLVRARTEELEAANTKLKEISITDGLTGLINRRHFDELFAVEFQRAYREKSSLAILMMDIDHFKSINDNYGHPFGDQCLRQVAALVRNTIRRPPDVAARYGGEEFIVMLPNTDLAGAVHVANAFRSELASQEISDGIQHTHVTASIGVFAGIPATRDDGEHYLKQADERLYRAKHNGRNQVVSDDSLETPATSP